MAHLLLVLAIAALIAAVALPDLTDLPLAEPALLLAACAGVFWLVALLWRRTSRRGGRKPGKLVLIDGSNVMHWDNGTPQISVVRDVAQALMAHGYTVAVIFDANAGYKLENRYMHDHALAKALGLPVAQVMVSPKGQPADGFLLHVARERRAPIVSNDRFRDWHEAFPEIAEPGRLIHGGFRDGAPYLRRSNHKAHGPHSV